MGPSQVVIDIGPNLLTFLLALVSAVGASFAAYYARSNNQQIKQANGNLARAINLQASEKAAAEASKI